MTRDACIYYARNELCLSRKRPNCPWWRDGMFAIGGKAGEQEGGARRNDR